MTARAGHGREAEGGEQGQEAEQRRHEEQQREEGDKAAAAAVAEWIRSRETGLDGLVPDSPEQTREETFPPLH